MMITRAFVGICLFITVCFGSVSMGICETYTAGHIPWSGYWWPTGSGGLVNGSDYRGHPAPVEKYDYVTSGTYNGPATAYGNQYYYNPGAKSWYGFCWNWAAASIMEPEPVNPGIYKGTLFRVGDKKGLLTVAYTNANYAPATSGGITVTSPEGFHGVLYEYIQVKGIPIVMDLGTDGEHWNFPVYQFTRESSTSGNTIHYQDRIYYASDGVGPDYVGTRVKSRAFYYYLVFNGNEIVGSGWENGSENEPPLGAWEIFGPDCSNPGIDYDEVRKIAAKDDDEFEGNDSQENAAVISGGSYSLLGVTDDWFKIDLKKGDRVEITGFADGPDIDMTTYPMEGELHFEREGATTVIEADEDGYCYMELVTTGGYGEVYYRMLIKQILGYQGILPADPSGSWVNGIGLLSPDKASGRIIISRMDRDGLPCGKSYLTSDLLGGLSGTLDDDFALSTPENGYIRIDSDDPLWGLQSVTYGDQDLFGSGLVPGSSAASELFYPHLAEGDWKTYFGMINIGDQPAEIVRRAYGAEGELLDSDTITLEAGRKMEDRTGGMEILRTGARSMSATAANPASSLVGYIKFENPYYLSPGKALVPLDPEPVTELVIPHAVSNDYWGMGIAVMNTGNLASRVTFSGYDEDGNLVGVWEDVINAKQNIVGTPAYFFPTVQPGEVASIRIMSHDWQPLCGVLLYASKNGLQLAGMPARKPSASIGYVPYIAGQESWGTGVGLINAGNAETDILCSLFSSEGDLLATNSLHTVPNQKLSGTVRGLFGGIFENAGYVRIESSGSPVSGIYLTGSMDGNKLMGGTMR